MSERSTAIHRPFLNRLAWVIVYSNGMSLMAYRRWLIANR